MISPRLIGQFVVLFLIFFFRCLQFLLLLISCGVLSDMDPEELARIYETMSLSDKPVLKVVLDAPLQCIGMNKIKLCLVAKIMSSKPVNRDGFRRNMNNIWTTNKDLEIEALGQNKFILLFGCEEDKRRISMGGPWHYDNSLIILVEPKGIGDLGDLEFRSVVFWVQFHNIPILCMNQETALFLGRRLGAVKDIDLGETRDCLGRYLQVRVVVDGTKQLERCLDVELESGSLARIIVKYERLPDYCWDCGLIGHTNKECPQGDPGHEYNPRARAKYADWLKASPLTKFRRPQDREFSFSKTNPSEKPSPNQNTTKDPIPNTTILSQPHMTPSSQTSASLPSPITDTIPKPAPSKSSISCTDPNNNHNPDSQNETIFVPTTRKSPDRPQKMNQNQISKEKQRLHENHIPFAQSVNSATAGSSIEVNSPYDVAGKMDPSDP